MKQSYSLVAITIANCVSAAWPYSGGGDGPLAAAAGISPCWKQCARNEGLTCSMTDISCLCRAANAGLIARANSCACNSCATGYNRSRKRDASSLRLGTLQAMCFAARRPLDQRVINAANSAAECGNGNTDDYAPPPPSYPPAPAPVAIPEEAPPPAPYAPPPPPPPPPPVAAPASYTPSFPGSASDSAQDSAYPKSPKNSYDESNPNALSKPDHTVIVPMVSEVESTTTVAFATLTVSVVPMPATGTTTPPPNASSASKTTSTGANGSKTTSTKTTSTKSSQSTGGALKKEAAWAGSMLGLVAAVAFGVA